MHIDWCLHSNSNRSSFLIKYYENGLPTFNDARWNRCWNLVRLISNFLFLLCVFVGISFCTLHAFIVCLVAVREKKLCVTSLDVIDLNVLVADERLIMIADRFSFFCYISLVAFFVCYLVCIFFCRFQCLFLGLFIRQFDVLFDLRISFASQVVYSSKSIQLTQNGWRSEQKFYFDCS